MPRGDFEIVHPKPIGCGQFGTVFRARRSGDGRETALKLILRKGENGAETIAAERHGAILQQRFASMHGMVPEVFDFDADGDDFYIAMELVEGPSLEERLRVGALPYGEAVDHARWLSEFLDRAHAFSLTVEGRAYRLLHNDLKPAHLKIPEIGERKVLDFGIAKALEESRELATDVGRTIAYAAPERLLSERVNVHADFWSLGVMLYEMLSGHRPYPDLEAHGSAGTSTTRSPLTRRAPRFRLTARCTCRPSSTGCSPFSRSTAISALPKSRRTSSGSRAARRRRPPRTTTRRSPRPSREPRVWRWRTPRRCRSRSHHRSR
jgi:serine/threonine protein kinase